VANVAVGFGVHTLFTSVSDHAVAWTTVPVPDLASLDVLAAALATIAFVGIWRFRWNVVAVVLACGAAGLLSLAGR
jgi:hypothetical protein